MFKKMLEEISLEKFKALQRKVVFTSWKRFFPLVRGTKRSLWSQNDSQPRNSEVRRLEPNISERRKWKFLEGGKALQRHPGGKSLFLLGDIAISIKDYFSRVYNISRFFPAMFLDPFLHFGQMFDFCRKFHELSNCLKIGRRSICRWLFFRMSGRAQDIESDVKGEGERKKNKRKKKDDIAIVEKV